MLDIQKINHLISENIMGWELLRVEYFGTEEETVRQKELEDWMEKNHLESIGEYYIDVEKDFWININDFSPATDIKAAWYVAEKFFNIEIEKDDNKYSACIYTGTTDPTCEYGSQLIYFEEAESAPMAICLASLKSLGINVR